MNILIKRTSTLLVAAAISSFFTASTAQAQAGFNNSGWSPQASNRASIAALIRQVEEDDSSTGAYAVGSTVTQLICGSSSGEGDQTSANAQANSSCIILNNSEGSVLSIDQLSDGDQDANAQSTDTVNVDETINYDAGDADDVLDVLAGNTE